MEEEKQQKTSPEIGLIDIEGYVYQLKREGVGTLVQISKGDYLILRVYREKKRKPIPTIIHYMIGQAAKCWEEDHTSKIQELEKWVEKWKYAVSLYYKKYGPLKMPRPE